MLYYLRATVGRLGVFWYRMQGAFTETSDFLWSPMPVRDWKVTLTRFIVQYEAWLPQVS